MADVEDLGVRIGDAGQRGAPQARRQGPERRDLERRLDLVDGLAVRRLPDAEAVVGEGAVPPPQGLGHVAVVVVVDREVPVRPVEADAVCQYLQGRPGPAVRGAVLRRYGVISRYCRVLLSLPRLVSHALSFAGSKTYACRDVLREVVSLLREVEDEVRHLDVGGWSREVKLAVLR